MDCLCVDFINSGWYKAHDTCREPLFDPGWVSDLLEKWRIDCSEKLTGPVSEKLIGLRSFLIETLSEFQTGPALSGKSRLTLNGYLSLAGFVNFVPDNNEKGLLLVAKPLRNDWNMVIARISLSFAELLASENAGRARFCMNEECRWLFMDESKNCSRKWCCDACASLSRVRRFRSKNR